MMNERKCTKHLIIKWQNNEIIISDFCVFFSVTTTNVFKETGENSIIKNILTILNSHKNSKNSQLS